MGYIEMQDDKLKLKEKEADNRNMFESLFDIAHVNALEMISVEANRQHLFAYMNQHVVK